MRLILLLLAFFWGVVGAIFILFSMIALSLFVYPCLIGNSLCTEAVPQIIQEFFFGRLPVSTLRMMSQILTLLTLALGLLSLYVMFSALRFMALRNNSNTVFSLIYYNLLFLLFLGITYGISWHIDPWLDYVERGCPSDGIQLCVSVSENGPLNDELRLETVNMYHEWLTTGRSTVLVAGSLLLILTILLWLVRKLPFAPSRSNLRTQTPNNVCALCGLEYELPPDLYQDQPQQPHCILCQPYVRVEAGFDSDSMWIKLIPIRKNIPVEQPIIDGNLKGIQLKAPPTGWRLEKNQRGHFTLSPIHTEFISEELTLNLPITRTNRGNSGSMRIQLKSRRDTHLYNYNRNWPEHETQITVNAN